jgi:hypothetical protein
MGTPWLPGHDVDRLAFSYEAPPTLSFDHVSSHQIGLRRSCRRQRHSLLIDQSRATTVNSSSPRSSALTRVPRPLKLIGPLDQFFVDLGQFTP